MKMLYRLLYLLYSPAYAGAFPFADQAVTGKPVFFSDYAWMFQALCTPVARITVFVQKTACLDKGVQWRWRGCQWKKAGKLPLRQETLHAFNSHVPGGREGRYRCWQQLQQVIVHFTEAPKRHGLYQ